MRYWKPFGQRVVEMTTGTRPFKKKARRTKGLLHRWLPRSLPKLRLSHQLLGFFVVVVLFPLLLLSFSIYSINQKAVRKQVAQFTEHTAEATYDELRLEMSWQEEQAQMAGEYWESVMKAPTSAQRQALIHRFFRNYADYEAVAFYDAAGHRKMFFQDPKSAYKVVSLPATLKETPRYIGFRLNYHKRVSRNPDLIYSLQVMVPGRLIGSRQETGTIAFFKRFPYMGNLIKERSNTFKNGFVIVDKTGVILAGPSQLVSQTLPAEDLNLFRSLKEGVMEEFSTKEVSYGLSANNKDDQDETKLEKVFIKVPKLEWGMVIESPYSIQRKFILNARAQSVALVFLCILFIIVLGLLYSQGINRNFRQLIKGIKALAEGRYSRKIRLITKSWTPYEIIVLTAEFNRMATKISTAWSSIQKLNQELVYKNQQDLFIAQATQRLHSSLELETVCETAAQLMSERPEILGALIYLQAEAGRFEHAARTIHPLLCSLDEGDLEASDHLLFAQTLCQKRSLHVDLSELSFLPPETTGIVQPILYQDTPIGVLVLIKPQQFDHNALIFDDVMIINLISSQIGVAIHQARQWKQLQKANTQLAMLDELKSNLIDTVSHELRTPLTNIKGYTSRLIRYEDTLDSATKIKSLKVIKQQADRLGRLVEDLLVIPDLEREEGIRVYPDRVNLNELLSRCIVFVEEKANRHIHILQHSEQLDVLVDQDRMEQVILNLLDNAIKYSYEDSVIEVSVFQSAQDKAQLQVFNQCDPIPAEEVQTLFAKFKRLDEKLTRTTRGTGLGLFITRGLVEAMGGTIWLEGHQGFRVLLEVPLYETHTGPAAQTPGLVIAGE